MTIEIRILKGDALKPALPALAGLRISVFREWPYLYDGSVDYEEKYLADVSASANSNSIQNSAARNPKATPYIGEMVLPQDESRFKEGYSYTNRAYAVPVSKNT